MQSNDNFDLMEPYQKKNCLARQKKKADISTTLDKACQECDYSAFEKTVKKYLTFILGEFEWYVNTRIELKTKYPTFFVEYNKLQGD